MKIYSTAWKLGAAGMALAATLAAAEPGERSTTIALGSYTIDTTRPAPDVPSELSVAASRSVVREKAIGDAGDYVLVKFPGPITAGQRGALEERMERVYAYLPFDTFLVKKPTGRRLITKDLGASWTGPYQPAYKIAPGLHKAAGYDDGRPAILMVSVYPDAPLAEVVAEVERLGLGEVVGFDEKARFSRLRLLVPPARAVRAGEALAKITEVFWIAAEARRTLLNDTTVWVAQTGTNGGQATPVHDQGILGQGQIVGVLDTGIDADMCYFRDTSLGLPPTNACNGGTVVDMNQRKVIAVDFLWSSECSGGIGSNEWDTNDHGTHVAGTAVGDNFANPLSHDPGDGLAPGAQLVMQDCGFQTNNCADCPGIGCPVVDLNPVFQQPYDQGARIHSNSWGDDENNPNGGLYSAGSEDSDEFMWLHKDFLLVYAAGNSGPGSVTVLSPATGKNVVSVGATNRGSSAESLASFSSCGPTADGRIKPDVTMPGNGIISANADNNTGTNNCGTRSMSGTSMAAPGVAGSTALIRQYYMDGWYPSGSANPGDAFTPSGALLKATLVNTARDMTGVSAIPSNCQGWGRVALSDSLHFSGDSRDLFVEDDAAGFAQGSSGEDRAFNVNVTSSSEPFKVTLTWTDFPATPGANPTIVNDLDLRVTGPGGTFLGNVFSGGQSTTGGSADRIDTVEQVLINNPTAGSYTVTVRSFTVPVGPQPFALVATGDLSTCSPAPIANAGADRTINDGDSTTIGTPAQAGHSYSWTPGGATTAEILVSPSVTTTYTVTATTSCGSAQDSVTVTVVPSGCTHSADFESGAGGWTNGASTCTTGAFVVGVPDATAWQVGGGNPGSAFFTAPNPGGIGTDDVDGGTCEALSPTVGCAGEATAEISLDYFHGQRDAADDSGDGFTIEVLNNGVVVATLVSIGDVTNNAAWTNVSTTVNNPGNIQLRVRATDAAGPGDIVEGGIDNVSISAGAPDCGVDADCDDGLFCNGAETCNAGTCQNGTAPNCSDGVSCTDDSCNEATDSCDNVANDANCSNGLFCDGAETCSATLDCQSGTAPNCNDGVGCTDDSCNEGTDSCDNVANDANCADPLFCNGVETCDAVLDCQAGSDPCTPFGCDEVGDVCLECNVDADCDNGLFCDGAETCNAGSCQAGSDPCPGQSCDEVGDVCQAGGACDHSADFESGAGGWTNGADTCSTGAFVVGVPDATTWQVGGGNPGSAFFTQPNPGGIGGDDVDGGTCEALSPVVDCAGQSAADVSLDYFHGQRDAGDDAGDGFTIEVLNDGVVVETIVAIGDVTNNPAWTHVSTTVNNPGDVRIRVRATDAAGGGDIVEGGIDNVSISPAGPECVVDADCDDGLFCNGVETCNAGSCQAGSDPCPGQSCDEVNDACVVGCTVDDDFEAGAPDWTNDPASTCTTGDYVTGNPTNPGGGVQIVGSHSGVTSIFTGVNTGAGTADVDGGNCILGSPTWAVGGASTLSVWYWHGQRDAADDATGDFFLLEVSTDGGTNWSTIASNGDTASTATWTEATAPIAAGSDVELRVQCSDGAGPGDLVECGIDDVSICPQ